MRSEHVLVWGLSLLAGSGCVTSHYPADPVPLARFCAEFFDAMCEPLEECGCGERALALCRAEEQELCAGFPSPAMVAAAESGRLRYDGAEAALLLRRMRERAIACESFVEALDWSVRDLVEVGGVFQGTVPPGQPCEVLGFELISECALGSCTLIGDARVCRGTVGAGERCDALHRCADLDAALRLDLGIDRLTLRCVPDVPGAEAGTCAPRASEGGACSIDDDCDEGACDGEVCRKRAIGESCGASRQCASGYCGLDRRCALGDAPVGAACDDPAACASHVCVASECLPAGCGTF